MQHPHQPCPLDAERGAELRLRQAAIGADHHQDRILRRADVERRKPPDEILEYPDLKAANEIAEPLIEGPKVDDRAALAPRRVVLQQGEARICGSVARRHSLPSKLGGLRL